MEAIQPYFTIVIPAWNRALLLPETIGSIQSQTFGNWECIVVDDGSTDNTADIVRAIEAADSRIRYIYQENAERSAARNRGADNARGLYLLFLDSDDSYTPEHLEVLYNFLREKQEPVAMVFTNLMYNTDKGLIEGDVPEMVKGLEFNYLLRYPITPSRACIHREIFNEFHFDPQIVIVEDQVLWICIGTKYPVYQLKKSTLHYRIHDGNSVDMGKNPYIPRLRGLKRLFFHPDYQEISARIPNKMKRFILAECYFNISRHHQIAGRYREMAKNLMRSFFSDPTFRNKERLAMILRKK
jgi:glycosyltransferase involved in cell wall biosynthesis